MRAVLVAVCSVALIGASDVEEETNVRTDMSEASPAEEQADGPVYRFDPGIEPGNIPDPQECRDRIHEAREAAGLPRLDRKPASPDEPHAMYAVDRRQDGCSVMVTMGNPRDIRPLPEPVEGPAFRLIPAQVGKR